MISSNISNNYYYNNLSMTMSEASNPCPNQRAITRPLLFVHNYSLFIFGSILNILAFGILMQRSLRCHSTFSYLAFLSLSNGLLSLVRFICWMLAYYFQIHFEHNLYTCRIHRFTLDFLTNFSLFTLVCVNIDRARTVTKHQPRRQYPKSAFQAVFIKESIIAIILCIYHFHWLVKYGYELPSDSGIKTICEPDEIETPNYYYFLTEVYPILELIVFFFLPLAMNIISTILIIRSLRVRMRTARRFTTQNSFMINSNEKKYFERIQETLSCCIPQTTVSSNIYSCCCFQIQCRRHSELRLRIGRSQPNLTTYEEENDSIQRRQSSRSASCLSQDASQPTTISIMLRKNHRNRRNRDIHLSAMLITLTVLYLVCNLPFNFYQAFSQKINDTTRDVCIVKFIHLLLDILQQTYFSTNFFLYVLTNRRFREAFYTAIMKICTRHRQCLRRRNNHQRRQGQSLSLNGTGPCLASLATDYQIISIATQPNQQNISTEMVLTKIPVLKQHTTLTQDENNELLSKIITSEELSSEHS